MLLEFGRFVGTFSGVAFVLRAVLPRSTPRLNHFSVSAFIVRSVSGCSKQFSDRDAVLVGGLQISAVGAASGRHDPFQLWVLAIRSAAMNLFAPTEHHFSALVCRH